MLTSFTPNHNYRQHRDAGIDGRRNVVGQSDCKGGQKRSQSGTGHHKQASPIGLGDTIGNEPDHDKQDGHRDDLRRHQQSAHDFEGMGFEIPPR